MKRKARIARCYTDQILQPNTVVDLDNRSGHHLSTVLRARIGQPVILFNGDGNNYAGIVSKAGKKTSIDVQSCIAGEVESPLNITLIQAIARGDKMDTIIQKATELGANTIQPIYSEHSVAEMDETRANKKHAHWHNVAISAAEQSGRCVLPVVLTPISLSELLSGNSSQPADEHRWILSPSTQKQYQNNKVVSRAKIMIGPESGFDVVELEQAAQCGYIPLRMGPRVLRTETAGPAAITLLQSQFGDMQLFRT